MHQGELPPAFNVTSFYLFRIYVLKITSGLQVQELTNRAPGH